MRYYTIQNEQLIIAENENALKRYYVNVKPLPDDYEENKYIVQNGELVVNPDYEAEKQEQEKEMQIEIYKNQLEQLDLKTVRALRAIVAGTSTNMDVTVIEELETQAQEIRSKITQIK